MKYEIQFAKSVGIPIKEDSKYTILYNTSIPLGIEGVATEITSKDIDIHKFNKISEDPSNLLFFL